MRGGANPSVATFRRSSPTGSRHIVQGDASVGPNPSFSTILWEHDRIGKESAVSGRVNSQYGFESHCFHHLCWYVATGSRGRFRFCLLGVRIPLPAPFHTAIVITVKRRTPNPLFRVQILVAVPLTKRSILCYNTVR